MLYKKIAFCGLAMIGIVCSGIPVSVITPAQAQSRTPGGHHAHAAGRQHRKPSVSAESGTVSLLLDRAYSASLIKDLEQAQHSIAILMYLFKPAGRTSALPDRIIGILARKRAEGVDVSVLLNVDEGQYGRGAMDTLNDTNLHTAQILEDNGIPVYLDSPHRTTHTKAVIIDARIVYVGSHNFTRSALSYNHEASVRIVSPAAARALLDYLEAIKHEQ